jgi:glycosyltransferase involved in cell wall biosynthesis
MITVLTATYNRAHTLERVFASLQRQSHRDFEWLVVDDGSTDGTAELMAALTARADFAVRYVAQGNGGRHTALNRGFALAAGEFAVVMDSDDWFTDDALARFIAAWEGIPAGERERFGAVAGLCTYPTGALIGTRYPADPTDSDFVEIFARHGVKGDKKEMFRTEAVRALPFPVFPGEKRVPFSLLLTRLSSRHRVRFFNHVVAVKEYQADGLTAKVDRLRMQSPQGSKLRYLEVGRLAAGMPARYRLRTWANYVRYALHAGTGVAGQLREVGSVGDWLRAAPVGLALYLRDRAGAAGIPLPGRARVPLAGSPR